MAAVPLRKLKSKAVLKGLRLIDIVALSGVPHSAASQVLNGRLIHPEYLARIEKVIREAPEPK